MLAKTYAAFKAANVPDDAAQAAAEELASYDARFASVDSRLGVMDGRLAGIEGRLTLVVWAIGINAAATVAILGVLLRH